MIVYLCVLVFVPFQFPFNLEVGTRESPCGELFIRCGRVETNKRWEMSHLVQTKFIKKQIGERVEFLETSIWIKWEGISNERETLPWGYVWEKVVLIRNTEGVKRSPLGCDFVEENWYDGKRSRRWLIIVHWLYIYFTIFYLCNYDHSSHLLDVSLLYFEKIHNIFFIYSLILLLPSTPDKIFP